MTEVIRFGDLTGFDDADVIPMQEDETLVVDLSEEAQHEDIKQDI